MNPDVLIRQPQSALGLTPEAGRRIIEIDLDRANGVLIRLVGVLQEQHGWNRERAVKELLRRMRLNRANSHIRD